MKPEDKGSQGKKDNAPGQHKLRTITQASTGQTQELSMYEIKQRREELLAAGWTGPGLDIEDSEPAEGGESTSS